MNFNRLPRLEDTARSIQHLAWSRKGAKRLEMSMVDLAGLLSSLVTIEYVSLLLFSVFSSLRIVSYVPQIIKVARDCNGASAISYATWGLWTGANLTTALYACINLGDSFLATVSLIYAFCCTTVIVFTVRKRRGHAPVKPSGAESLVARRQHLP